jgi:hypothetical protein
MMTIELRRIAEPVAITCPHCAAPIFALEEHAERLNGVGAWIEDGDTIPGLYDALAPEQRGMGGFDYHLGVGARPCCGKSYIVITATFVNGWPDDGFRGIYFWQNGDRGEETNYLAQRGERTWLVRRFKSPLGPLFEHELGP